MLASIPGFLRTPLVVLLIVLSTVVHTTPLFVVAFLKWIIPIPGIRTACATVLVRLAESWIAVNSGLIDMFTVMYPQIQHLDFRRDAVKLDVPVLPELSVAVQVTVVSPSTNVDGEGGAQVSVAPESASLAVAP